MNVSHKGNNTQRYIDINTCIQHPFEMCLVSHSMDLGLYFISLADLASLVSNDAYLYIHCISLFNC